MVGAVTLAVFLTEVLWHRRNVLIAWQLVALTTEDVSKLFLILA